jgi:hypothetical protein
MKVTEAVQVNAQDRFGHTPLWDAIARMDKESAELVRDAGGKMPEDCMFAQLLCEHANKNNVAIFELLHSLKMDVYIRVRYYSATFHTWLPCARNRPPDAGFVNRWFD